MQVLTYILTALTGVIGGIAGGMGMGGGTLLIPALTFFFGFPQKNAQAINLVSFIPMSVVALIIHVRQKRVDFKNSLFIIIPAVVFSVAGSFLAEALKNELLKRLFGYFLILLAIFTAIMTFFVDNKNGDKNSKCAKENPFYNQKNP